MKISSILRDLFAHRFGEPAPCHAAWVDDPYGHPDIRSMTERERADLPPPVHAPAPSATRLQAGCRSAS